MSRLQFSLQLMPQGYESSKEIDEYFNSFRLLPALPDHNAEN
jgi:hypothetical protein